MKRIRDIEEAYDLLKEARDIFRNLGGDGVVSLGRMRRCGRKIDKLIDREEK